MIALLVVVGNLAWSQAPASNRNKQASKTPEERATANSKRLAEKLNLNAEQQKSVYGLLLQRAQQVDADRAKIQGDKKAMRDAMKQNQENFENNLAKILTADQKTKYDKLKQERKEKRKEKRNPPSDQK
jgi:Spy/CpxP family protein refolding chaperone